MKTERVINEEKTLMFEKTRWIERLKRNEKRALGDMSSYLASKTLGKSFNQDYNEYCKEIGFTLAREWIRGVIKGEIKY